MKVLTLDSVYDERFPVISNQKRIYKTTEGGIKIMCDIIERNREEAKLEERIRVAKDFIKAGLTTFEALKSSGIYTKEELAAIQA